LTKHVVGGNATSTDWTLTATGPTSISGAGSITSGTAFSSGTYILTESSGPKDYSPSLWNCTGAVINGNSITLSLNQAVNCDITNTYITPLPVSKVVFLPGLGASWNADAILNCKTDGYSGDWTMAPFAKNVYENILSALPAANWNTKLFYYDWRRDVRDNASSLSTFINNDTSTDEKVNLVGHSMGGLVGRAYLESQQGQKVDSYLSVGSPHQGTALAYPLVSGGEVWDSNLISKIAKTILIKRCGDNIPSIKNLLPTTDYLKDSKTNQLKPVANMVAKNNWLPNNFSVPFGDVKIGTLSGTGFPTLNIIKVSNPTKRDIQLGNWLDGKPTGKEKIDQGDGTVLTSSSQLTNADNQTINQNHSGLVASQEGISKILNFLGTAPAQGFRLISPVLAADLPKTSIYAEPNSMMVIIGYPGNFWVTDPDGIITKDEQGMVSYPTPKSGEYKLEIVPTSGDTLFIVTQVLPNGETLYKEYRIKGHQPTSKVITLDNEHPSENVLKDPKPKKEIKKEQDDHHRFWDDFWNHFHKD
jgi:pimeloyl-ACP methyl ester carboxylesterase